MQEQDVLEVGERTLGQVVVKLDRLAVALQQQALVHPVGQQEEEGCRWVQNWHSTRVEERHPQHYQHVRVAELEHEFSARVHVFVVFLCQCLGLLTVAGAAAVNTAPDCVHELETEIGEVGRDHHQHQGDDDSDANLFVPLLGELVVGG